MEPSLPTIPLADRAADAPSPCLANSCSACCHDTEMLLTEADVARLRAQRPAADFAFEAPDGFLQLRTRESGPVAGQKGRPCVFLDDIGRCSVFSARPEGCRLYPAVWDQQLRRALLDAEHCPHTEGFALDAATAASVESLVAVLLREQARRRKNRFKGPSPAPPTRPGASGTP